MSPAFANLLEIGGDQYEYIQFMPHFDINYIISKQGKKSKDFFPCFIAIT